MLFEFKIKPFENPPLPKVREQLIKLGHLKHLWGAGHSFVPEYKRHFLRSTEELPKFSFTEPLSAA